MSDEPSNNEAAGDEVGTVTLADMACERFESACRGYLSPRDVARVESIEMFEERGGDLDELRSALGEGVASLRDFVDDEIGHRCPECGDLVTGWCPTSDVLTCTSCTQGGAS